MNLRKLSVTLVGAALLLAVEVQAQSADPRAYQTIAGVSPEPIAEGAGLRSVEDMEAFLDGAINAQLKAQSGAGAVVSVVKDGQLFFAKGYGYANLEKGEAVDADRTLFRPGSVSKLFTWTAIMQLVEQGKLDLDADVNTYITQFKLPETFPGQPVTLRNVMTHTGGFEDGSIGYLIIDKAENLDSIADGLSEHIPQRVRAPAGGDHTNGDMASYSNWATHLAGLIIENVSGMSFDEYIEKNIFTPLGMTQSSFRQPLPEALAPQMAVGYGNDGGVLKAKPFELVNYGPAGSLSATGTDMARFMIAHLQKGALGEARILKEETAKLMHTRANSPNPYINGAALGFYENHINGRRLIVHGGDTQWFHSELNLLPEEGVGIFVSVNAAPNMPFSARTDLMKAFMQRYYPAKLPALTAPTDFAERVARYTGTYQFNRQNHSTIEKIFGLMPAISVVPSERNTLLLNYGLPVSTEWVEVKPDVFRRLDDDGMLAFSEDAQGNMYLLNPVSLPSMAAHKLRLIEKPGFHWTILGLGLLGFIVAFVSGLRHWSVDRTAEAKPRLARRLATALGACQLLFIVLVGISMTILMKDPLVGYPALLRVSLVLPLLAIPLTLGVLWFSLAAWRTGWWTRYARLQYTLVALTSAAFLWSLCVWNLLGYKFG